MGRPVEFLLQRKLFAGDGCKWRTVVRFSLHTAPQVQQAAQLLAGADPRSLWRVVEARAPLVEVARWLGDRWAA